MLSAEQARCGEMEADRAHRAGSDEKWEMSDL